MPAQRPATNWRKRLVSDPAVLTGKPVIKGTRISAQLVLELLAAGWTAREIADEYDRVTVADVRACLAYAAHVVRS